MSDYRGCLFVQMVNRVVIRSEEARNEIDYENEFANAVEQDDQRKPALETLNERELNRGETNEV